MPRRLRAWRALSTPDKLRLLLCVALLPVVHTALAVLGYRRTRALVEALTRRRKQRTADQAAVDAARALARLAATAGRHGVVEATCLRQSLLIYGWLRLRGQQPTLELGVKDTSQPFHAWVALGGCRLLPGDAGFIAFQPTQGAPAQ